jgi:hypothetical protein
MQALPRQREDSALVRDHRARMDHAMPMPHRPYRRLLFMAILSFISMYVLMYMMVDRMQNVLPNVNQFYMAGMMTAPMIIIELLLMRAMYPDKRKNGVILAGSAVLGVMFMGELRTQTFVDDTQFMKSMIPHHAGAILMCEEARLEDPELRELCLSIIESQQQEIDFMRTKLQEQGSGGLLAAAVGAAE